MAFLHLEDGAPVALQEAWQILSDHLLADVLAMRNMSSWCAFLDYCEQCPGILSQFYQNEENNNATPTRKCWLLGGGTEQPASYGILSSHNWTPALLVPADKWFSLDTLLAHHLFDDLDGIVPDETTVGLVSWRDENALRFILQESLDIPNCFPGQKLHEPRIMNTWFPRYVQINAVTYCKCVFF